MQGLRPAAIRVNLPRLRPNSNTERVNVKNIFVGNLDFAVTDHLSLRGLPPDGNIESVDLVSDHDTGPVARFCVRRNRRRRPGGPRHPQSERPQARARLLNVVKRVPRLRAAAAAGLAAFGCTVAAEAALAPLIASKNLRLAPGVGDSSLGMKMRTR